MYVELYKNHFRSLRCSRATFLAFANYTLTALDDSPVAALKALATQLRTSLRALGGSVVERQQLEGSGQGQTRTRRELLTLMRDFVRDLHADVLVPRYRTTAAELDTLLPGGLTAFNEANNDAVPVLFEAFRNELRRRVEAIGQQPDLAATRLLEELAEATRLKNEGDKQKRETIADIGAQWRTVCDDLWEAHCRALAEFCRTPEQARTFFNYGLLPRRNPQRANEPTTPPTHQPAATA
jgi:hypothetical protein